MSDFDETAVNKIKRLEHDIERLKVGEKALASATPTAGKIPIADEAGKLAVGWLPVIPNRNVIINGGFTVNQRGYASGATLAAGVYGHDRWKGGSAIFAGDYTFTQLASPTLITFVDANRSLIQVIENKNVYGGTYTLSWTGTCGARYAINSATPAGAYAANPIIITGQTPGTVMSVEFGNGGTLCNAQLELGSVVTAFEFRPFSQELALCQRYFETSFSYGTVVPTASAVGRISLFNYSAGTIDTHVNVQFKVTKRDAPTMAAYNPADGAAAWASFDNTGNNGTLIYKSLTAVSQINVQWSASAEL